MRRRCRPTTTTTEIHPFLFFLVPDLGLFLLLLLLLYLCCPPPPPPPPLLPPLNLDPQSRHV